MKKKMKINIMEARKLKDELVKKYKEDVSIDITFRSWGEDIIQVYVSNSTSSAIKHYYNAEEIRKDYKL